MKPLIAIGLLLTVAVLASATSPNDWLIGSVYTIPPCNAQTNVKHFEVSFNEGNKAEMVGIYDQFKTRGFSNIQMRIMSSGIAVWSGDCTVAT